MDDILKRMLAVEAEARSITDEAEKKALEIRTEARRRANEEVETSQAKLASDMDAVMTKALSDASHRRDTELATADQELEKRATDFSAMISKRIPEIVKALAFGNE